MIRSLARRRAARLALARGLVLALLLGAAWPAAVAAQTLRWDMPNEYPATSIHGEGDQFFARVLAGRGGPAGKDIFDPYRQQGGPR